MLQRVNLFMNKLTDRRFILSMQNPPLTWVSQNFSATFVDCLQPVFLSISMRGDNLRSRRSIKPGASDLERRARVKSVTRGRSVTRETRDAKRLVREEIGTRQGVVHI